MFLTVINFILVQLLHKFHVRANGTSIKLLSVIKNPITNHLPAGCRKVATSCLVGSPIKARELVVDDAPIAFVVGAKAHGQVLLCGLKSLHQQFVFFYLFIKNFYTISISPKIRIDSI